MPCSSVSFKINRSPLLLLLRVNATHSWRRLLAMRDQSRLLTAIIGLFIVGYLVLSFWLFYYGLKFIAKFPGLGAVLTERLMFVLFAFLFALLLLSNLVISYTNLFRNRETAFLLTLPVPTQTIFRWKFIESIVLASWAFLFLIAPLLAAFGLVRGVPWHFYLVTLLLIGLFIVLPGVIGACAGDRHRAVSGPAQFSDRRSWRRPWSLLAFAAFWWKTQAVDERRCSTSARSRRSTSCWPRRASRCFRSCRATGCPSAVLQWAEGILRGAAFFALVLLSNTLFFGGIAFTRFGNLFYDTASAVQSRAGGGFKLNCSARAQTAPGQSTGLLEIIRREIFLASTATPARWPSRTCACSGATRRNGASP